MCLAAAAIIMVQTYGSRQYAALNAADMEMAVNKVRSGEMSIRRACAYYSVPRSTYTSQPRQRCS
jgi:helix-turn-helix, Psq domain